jgi:hypothetical protein
MEVRRLSAPRAAYIAGLIDGEGTITLARKYKGGNRQLIVSISNTERVLLDFVLRAVGAGKITRKRTTRTHHTPSYTYAIGNRQALNLLEQIQPYLQTYKAARCSLILRDYVALTPRNGKCTLQLKQARSRFEHSVLRLRARGPLSGGTAQDKSIYW